MPLFARNLQELTASSLEELAINTNITKLTPGSKARAIVDSVNKRLQGAYETFDLNLARAFVSAAPGQYLDLIGDLLGVTRIGSNAASASSDLEVVKFYVDSGTFGDINGSSDIIVPANTRISSRANNAGASFRTLNTEVLPASASEAFISVEASSIGDIGNVGSNTLVYHNFTGYSDISNKSLLVDNLHPIANGEETESDDNYRFRIANRVLESEAANETAIRLAVLSTPGVADSLIIPRYRGIGTVGVIVESITPQASNSLIDNVKARIEGVKAMGEIAYVRAQNEIGLVLRTSVEYQRQLPESDFLEIEQNLNDVIVAFIQELGLGDDLVINQLVSRMFSVSEEIRSFGIPGTPLEEVYIYRPSKLEDNRVREKLLGDYLTRRDERVIIETTVNSPIVFTRKYARR